MILPLTLPVPTARKADPSLCCAEVMSDCSQAEAPACQPHVLPAAQHHVSVTITNGSLCVLPSFPHGSLQDQVVLDSHVP